MHQALLSALDSLSAEEAQVGSYDKCWTGLVSWKDGCYGTIDYVKDPYWKDKKGADGSSRFESLGTGCKVAEHSEDLVRDVVAKHPFATPYVIMSDGYGYGTSMAGNIRGWGPGDRIPNSNYLLNKPGGKWATGITHSKVFIECDSIVKNTGLSQREKERRENYNPNQGFESKDYRKSLAWPLKYQNQGPSRSTYSETWWGLSDTNMLWEREFYHHSRIVRDCMDACNDDCGYAVNLSLGKSEFKDYSGKHSAWDDMSASPDKMYDKYKAKAMCRCYTKEQTEKIFGVSAESTHDPNRKPVRLNGSKDWVLYTMNPYATNKWCGTGLVRNKY